MSPSPFGCGLGPRGYSFSRPQRVYFCYGPVTRSLPWGDLVDRLQSFSFHHLCYPNYGALTSTPAGLSPAEHASLHWTHNRTCRSPASGFPTGFTVRHTESKLTARGFGAASNSPSPLDTAISGGACHLWCLQAHRQSPRPRHLRKRTRSQGPFLIQHYPASTVIRPCPTPAMAAAFRDVEAATLALDGSPPITRTTFPTCRAHYPGGSSGCACRLLPRSCSLPQMAGGSASALSLSMPAQASLTLRPAGLLNRLKRPLSRGSSPAGYPTEPLVSYQINRQLSGWNLPPLVIRAFGAHYQQET